MIYLDNASTTRMDPRVFDAMIPYLGDLCGNPNSPHAMGRQAKEAVEKARRQVADMIRAEPEQIVFTHSATDANRMVFDQSSLIPVVSSAEHSSVLDAAFDGLANFYGTAPVTDAGSVSAETFRSYLAERFYGLEDVYETTPAVVSVMLVNNETGAMNDVKELAENAHEYYALFHTDATAAAGAVKIDVRDLGCDFMTFAAHKMHGPKGVAALYRRNPHIDFPYDGTPDVPAIVGFGEACRIQKEILSDRGYDADYNKLADVFLTGLTTYVGSIFYVNTWGHSEGGHFNRILSLRFPGIDAETLVMLCSMRGLMISAGAACEAHDKKPSHVLTAMGLTPDEARSSVRISFSRMTTAEECAKGAEIIAGCVGELRRLGSEDT